MICRVGVVGFVIALLLATGCRKPDRTATGPNHPGQSESEGAKETAQGPLLPLANHPRFTLSNLRFNKTPGGETFVVDWKTSRQTKGAEYKLIVMPATNPFRMELDFWTDKDSGTISGQSMSIGYSRGGPPLSSGCEMYLISTFDKMEFKLSNSLTLGSAAVTQARKGTDAELAMYRKLLAAAPPKSEGFVFVPESVVLPRGTAVKVLIGRELVDATVEEHVLKRGKIRAKRKQSRIIWLGLATKVMIDPEVLKQLQK